MLKFTFKLIFFNKNNNTIRFLTVNSVENNSPVKFAKIGVWFSLVLAGTMGRFSIGFHYFRREENCITSMLVVFSLTFK